MSARLKSLLKQDRLVRVFLMGQLCYPKLIEMVAWQGGFDAVWFDQEHTGLTTPQIEDAARAARASGIDCFVRLPATDYAAVMRPLEAGAGGVMASMVRSVREVENLLMWTKFHPRGLRGVNGSGVDGRYGGYAAADYYRQANVETFVAVQIEHIDAVNVVEQIAAVPDLDLLFIGPADLSQSMGLPGEWEHPRVWQAVERVAKAAQAHRVPWAILPKDAGHAKRCVDLGCRMLSLGVDTWAFSKGIKAIQGEFEPFFSA